MNACLLKDSDFVIGANYWASHAGTRMWSDWQEAVVAADFSRLAAEGIQILRVFPLWPDFQPLHALLGGHGAVAEYRHGETALADDDAGAAGVTPAAMEHFLRLADLAQQNGLSLIIGLVTGWMSGRCYVPPALEGKNMLTDPVAIIWQVRFVQHFVRRLMTHPAVAAWDLGNECNCTAQVPNRESAWLWTSTIVNAIRAIDRSRPIVSGMHSLTPAGLWTMQDQGELTDILTTHPYPVFTPHCDQDPVNTIRTLLHATAESLFYAGIGGKPCLVEEIGTLGPMIADEQTAADFARCNLFSNWANGMAGFLWWCAHDQSELTHAPYDWFAVERELGLIRTDGSIKPVLREMGRFRSFLQALPAGFLPERLTEGVCILSQDQDQWGVAYSSLILAKQAGFDLIFRYESQPLPDAPLYLLPCIRDHRVISRRHYRELMDRVSAGATLYLSFQDGFLSQFEELSGLRVKTRERRRGSLTACFASGLELSAGQITDCIRLNLELVRAEALAREADGNPLITRAANGRGTVYFCGFPLEMMLTQTVGAFHGSEAQPWWQIYSGIFQAVRHARVVTKQDPLVGVTEHVVDAAHRIVVMINYSPDARSVQMNLADGWQPDTACYGQEPRADESGLVVDIGGNDAVVWSAVKASVS
jgi:hypothetical protein